jgi:hypothetical protein
MIVDNETSYEIFKKRSDNSTVLVEAVKGIEEAQRRVIELNNEGRDEHFIFDSVKASVIEPSEPTQVIDPLAP